MPLIYNAHMNTQSDTINILMIFSQLLMYYGCVVHYASSFYKGNNMSNCAPTYGEQLVCHLMQKLPQEQFFCYAEPRIDNATVRSRYPDFVIVWRERGVICVEVKDWKHIVGGDQRDVRIKKDGKDVVHRNPYNTARDYTFHLKEKLEQRRELLARHHGGETLSFPVEPLVVLTHQDLTTLAWLQREGLFPENGVMCSDDLVSVETFHRALQKIRWTFKPSRLLTDAQIRTIQHTLSIVEVRAKSASEAHLGAKCGSLIPEQDRIIWSPIPVREGGISTILVRGVVGSGKTIVLTKKADLLSELRPDLKILVTTFNNDLADDLKAHTKNRRIRVCQIFDLIREILGDNYPRAVEYRGQWDPRANKSWCQDNEGLFNLPPDFVSLEISRRKDLELILDVQYRNDLRKRDADLLESEIDELCVAYDLYVDFQRENQSQGEHWQDYEDTVRMAITGIHGHKYHRYFDIIMVDEGQDFSPNMFDLIRSMIKPGGLLFVCDDPLQSMWRRFDLSDRGLQNARIEVLKLPLRTTREIADAAQSLFELIPAIRTDDVNEIYPAQTDHLVSGDRPQLISYCNKDEERRQILQHIEQQRLICPADAIAVITPYFDKLWHKDLNGSGIYYGNFNLIKGLEFQTVFIAQLDKIFESEWNKRIIMRRWLYRRLFVAMTRARKSLYLSFTGSLPLSLLPLEHYCTFLNGIADPATTIDLSTLPT